MTINCSPNLVFMSILLIFIHVLLKSNSSSSYIIARDTVLLGSDGLTATDRVIDHKKFLNFLCTSCPQSRSLFRKSERKEENPNKQSEALFALIILPSIPLVPPPPTPRFTHYSLTVFYTYLPTLYLPTHPIYKSMISRI